MNSPATPETLAAAVAAYRSGKGIDVVVRDFHVGKARVWRAIEEAGLERHQPGRRRSPRLKSNRPGGKRPFSEDAERGRFGAGRRGDAFKTEAKAAVATFRVVRLVDGAVLSGGNSRRSCEGQLAVINTYAAVAEIREPKAVAA